jgi:GntR family transcriptional regulator/MocR family aminotransferase
VTLSAARRQQLLDWAERQNAWVIEDDYDSEFRFDSRPLATLQGLDGGRRVCYIGTFSKVLFPSLRTAYVVVPRSLISAFRQAIFFAGQEPSLHIQSALAEFIHEGHFFSHIRRMRRVYKRRQASFVTTLARELGDLIPIERPAGGMQLSLTLPEDYSAA